jgi:hypothetical protein
MGCGILELEKMAPHVSICAGAWKADAILGSVLPNDQTLALDLPPSLPPSQLVPPSLQTPSIACSSVAPSSCGAPPQHGALCQDPCGDQHTTCATEFLWVKVSQWFKVIHKEALTAK